MTPKPGGGPGHRPASQVGTPTSPGPSGTTRGGTDATAGYPPGDAVAATGKQTTPTAIDKARLKDSSKFKLDFHTQNR